MLFRRSEELFGMEFIFISSVYSLWNYFPEYRNCGVAKNAPQNLLFIEQKSFLRKKIDFN